MVTTPVKDRQSVLHRDYIMDPTEVLYGTRNIDRGTYKVFQERGFSLVEALEVSICVGPEYILQINASDAQYQ